MDAQQDTASCERACVGASQAAILARAMLDLCRALSCKPVGPQSML